ncbi:MAG: hypothetical protein JWO90_1981, partial [Solirubrobacterales bacterium]|nr:hypothetical protein [Solirubrobacterales bacterium]
VMFATTDPDARFALDARGPRARVDADGAGPADLTLTLSAELAERLLQGRLDVARALRAGELRSDRETGMTLAVASVLSALPRIGLRPRNRGPVGT